MPHRPPKKSWPNQRSSQKPCKNILDALGGPKPDGEDFFVIDVIFDDPTNPNWDCAQSCVGDWEQAKASAGAVINAWADNKKRVSKGLRIVMYQGEGARSYLLAAMKEEARYQQEVKSN
jgi:hypothetical protein